MKISACVITKNEEKNIARSINSYQSIVDEIIVVDSESTDDTVAIAESLGAKVYTRPWTNDFAAAKNFALDQASGDWILFLDADEYFADGHDVIVREMVERAERERIEVIECPRYECQNRVVGITHVQRIFQNSPQIRYKNRIHENLCKSDGNALAVMATDACVIYHTGYDPSILKEKLLRNLMHLDMEDDREGGAYKHYYKAECYFSLGEHEACVRELSYVFNAPEFEELLYGSHKIFRIYIFQITSMLQQKQKYSEYEIAEYVSRAIEDFGNHPEIKQQEASYNFHYHRVDAVIAALEEAFRLQERYSSPYENMFVGSIAGNRRVLSDLYKEKGDWENARRMAVHALCEGGDELLGCFFSALYGAGTPEKRELAEKLLNHEDENQLIRWMEEAWRSGNHDLFTEWLLILLKRHPEMAADHMILCRIYLLQRNDAGVLNIAGRHAGDRMYESFALAIKLAAGKATECSEAADVLSALEELLRVGAYEEAKAVVGGVMIKKYVRLNDAAGKVALARLFEQYGQWAYSGGLYLDAAHMVTDHHSKGAQYINAARMFYLSSEWKCVLDTLSEALPFALQGNHLPIEILRWVMRRVRSDDESLYRKIRRLEAKYVTRYDLTYDLPLPEREKQEV